MRKLLITLTIMLTLTFVILLAGCKEKGTKISYEVKHYQETLDEGYELYETETLNGKTGYKSKASSKDYDGFSLSGQVEQIKLSKNGDNIVKIYYDRNEYNLNLTVDDESHGEVLLNSGKYKYGYEIKLDVKEYPFYKFSGWYNGNDLVSDKKNYKFIMPYNDLALKAKFENDTIIDNFEYEIDGNEIILTGIKDKTAEVIEVPSYITKINEGALSGCSNVKKLILPFFGGENKENGTGIIYPLGYIFGKEEFAGSTYTSQRYRNTIITDDSYSSSLGITSYYIPNSLEEVVLTKAKTLSSYGFCNTNIKTLTIPNTILTTSSNALTESSVEKIYYDGSLSDYCKVDFGEYSLLGRCDFYYRDDNNEYITFGKDLIIPNDVEELGRWCFAYNTTVENVTFGKNIKATGSEVFYNCDNLKNVYFNGNINEWASIKFESNSNPIEASDSINLYLLDEEGDIVYNGKKYKLVADVTISNIESIEEYAFVNYSNLGVVVIEDGIKKIKEYAFSYSSITEIYIPESVTYIDVDAFYKCSNLKKIHNKSSVNINIEDYSLPEDCVID